MNTFVHKGRVYFYDGAIYTTQVDPEYLVLTRPFHFGSEGRVHKVPTGTRWNGASSPPLPLARFIAPRFYRNIKASCIHDYLCSIAKSNEDRLYADNWYFLAKKYIERDHNIFSMLSWLGVRIGAFLNIGNYFKRS